MKKFLSVYVLFCCLVSEAKAAIQDYDGDAAIISSSFSGETTQIINAKNSSEITVEENVVFDGNSNQAINVSYEGGLIHSEDSKFVFNGQNEFINNSITYNNTISSNSFSGGMIYSKNSEFKFGDNASFSYNNGVFNNVHSSSYDGGLLIYASNGSDIVFKNNALFQGNLITGNGSNMRGGLIYINDSNLEFGNGTRFIDNNIYKYGHGGIILLENGSDVSFGNNTLFENNISYAYQGALVYGEASNLLFGDNTVFRNNSVGTETAKANSGLSIVSLQGGTTSFGNNTLFENNKIYASASASAAALYLYGSGTADFMGDVKFVDNGIYGTTVVGGAVAVSQPSTMTIHGDALFDSNFIVGTDSYTRGGAVYIASGGNLNFLGNAKFVDNYSKSTNGDAYGGAFAIAGGTVTFRPSLKGQSVLFENNRVSGTTGYVDKLNSIAFGGMATKVVFDMKSGTWADVRDPIVSLNASNVGTVDKMGDGGLYLWGDNSEFFGNVNIQGGSFYAMFDENSDVSVDPYGQRKNFNLNNVNNVSFASNTFFRPKMNNAKNELAQLNMSKVNGAGNAVLIPYEVSKLDTGTYHFNNDYTGFNGFDSNLAKLDVNAGSVDLEIKKDLKGYEGLTAAADAYRKLNLGYYDRFLFDELYRTGSVTDEIRDLFEVTEGGDIIVFEQAHRAGIRQFNRQISSRIYNRNCPTCGEDAGFADEHMWFNVGQNWIDKESDFTSLGYTYRPTSFALGYDTDIIPQELNVGMAIGYAFGQAKTKTTGVISTDDINEYLISFYSKYKPFRWYVTNSIGGGLITNKTKHQTDTVNARGDYNASAVFANVETGYDFGNACTVLEPYIGAEWTRIRTESHSEKGEGARHFGAMTWDVFEVPIGIRNSRDFYFDDYVFTPSIDVAYARNLGDVGSSTRGYFVGGTGESWKVSSGSVKRDSIRAGINFKINSLLLPFAVNLAYAVDYRSDYTDNQIYTTLRWDF